MKQLTIVAAFACLMAVASAMSLKDLMLSLDSCVVVVGDHQVDLANIPLYNESHVIDGRNYEQIVSACKPSDLIEGCDAAYAYINGPNLQNACYKNTPTSNGTAGGNVTTTAYGAPSTAAPPAVLGETTISDTLTITYSCDPKGTDALDFDHAIFDENNNLHIYYTSAAACAVPVPVTPEPSTIAPAPINDGGDDDNGLSSWAIVGIIVGCVVVLVGIGIACWKCRSRNEAEGEYERV